jgi:hypothetical protein
MIGIGGGCLRLNLKAVISEKPTTCPSPNDLAFENLALRQQLAVLKRAQKRPMIGIRDRLFWIWLSQVWSD